MAATDSVDPFAMARTATERLRVLLSLPAEAQQQALRHLAERDPQQAAELGLLHEALLRGTQAAEQAGPTADDGAPAVTDLSGSDLVAPERAPTQRSIGPCRMLR